jgi:signal transduction histidine kinase
MEINVSDTGKGISEADQQHIFDRFYQVDPSRSGGGSHSAGLGLAIVKEIIQAHGGRISVRSQEGRGSIFSVRLPLSQPNATTLMSKRKR